MKKWRPLISHCSKHAQPVSFPVTFYLSCIHGGGGGSSIVKVPGDVPPARVYFFGLLV